LGRVSALCGGTQLWTFKRTSGPAIITTGKGLGLSQLEDLDVYAGSFDSLDDRFGHGSDVAISAVEDDADLGGYTTRR
jgi:hypothetical protein